MFILSVLVCCKYHDLKKARITAGKKRKALQARLDVSCIFLIEYVPLLTDRRQDKLLFCNSRLSVKINFEF